ncbi:ABC transporter substrate-binding protein [Sediminispirochaeta smaragdinae]|jgi:polar amino acid transport system substrate-binding protein|uniref:Extracellular solute-binding protein family 3 n=1 Tax=Sediminispirochaeta smaragdinae (strain DSM 11293 / JCM 15392 / SEBR 4228) TaxID=573413 RepID=E1R456_SEDSS|nr:ABC transporter substrate-binding protein [Sediminispirochaeta smaragdinae]ADK80478.1 extracellular solute-binding protein family 3 [Sediminispirochaeta smaragdinae DSM 11293]
MQVRFLQKKSIILLALVMILSLLVGACSNGGQSAANATKVQEDALQKILKSGKLVIATDLTGPPVQYKDAEGKPAGLIVELMELAAKELGVEIEWQDMAWESLIPSLTAGKVDMIAANMSMSLSRAKAIRFSDPYMFTGVYAMVRKDSGIRDWEELLEPGKILAATMGSSHATYLKENYNYEPKQYESSTDFINELKNGRIDGVMDDELLLLEFCKQNPEFTLTANPVRPDVYGLAFTQGNQNDTLVDWFNWFLKWEKLNGNYGTIYKKFVGKDWTPNPVIQ